MEKFDWKKALWKGIRPALLVALTAFGNVLFQNLDVDTLAKMGIPAIVGLAILETGRNIFKNRDKLGN